MKETIIAKNAPAALGPYNAAVAMGSMVFTSGQIGIDPAIGRLPAGVEAQTAQMLTNLENVLMAAGCSLADVVKTTLFVTDMGNFALVNDLYGARFGKDFPARSCVEVGKLPGGALVEIEAVAFRK